MIHKVKKIKINKHFSAAVNLMLSQYTCLFCSNCPICVTQLTLFPKAAAPVTFTLPLKDTAIKESETVTLECQLSKPDQKITWYRNGKEIIPSGHITISSDGLTHSLSINKSLLEDSAEYSAKCGDQATSARLTVEGWNHILHVIFGAFQIYDD